MTITDVNVNLTTANSNKFVLTNTPVIEDNSIFYKIPLYEQEHKTKAIVKGNFIEIGNTSINILNIDSMKYEENRMGAYISISTKTNMFEFYEDCVENFNEIKDLVYNFSKSEEKHFD